ncbi:MAG: hypothetical protein WD063_15040 [Pirellulales bacterium]
MNTKIILCLSFAASLMCSQAHAAIMTVASVDPLLAAPILYDSGGPIPAGGFATPTLNFVTNGGLSIGGLEVLGPGSVYTLSSDGGTGADSTVLQLNESAGPGTNLFVGLPAALSLNARGYDLTSNPASGLLGVAATGVAPGGGPGSGLPAIYELDPLGFAPPAVYAGLSAKPTTSGLTYGAGGMTAALSTDGVAGAFTAPPLPAGIYPVPAGGPELPGILSSVAPPGGVGVPGDDHVVTLDGRTIFLGDGSHEMFDVSGGAGAVALLIDLDAVPGLLPFLAIGGVRGAVSPVDGNIFTGWGLPAGMQSLIRVDQFGAGASPAIIGLDNVRDVDFGPSTFAPGGPLASGFSLYITEVDFTTGPTPFSNIWEVGILVPEPSSVVLAVLGLLTLAAVAYRRKFAA